MHSPTFHGRNSPFLDTLRDYPNAASFSPAARGRSNSPRAKDYFMTSMTTFSDRYRRQMRELHDYQKRLDDRLARPRHAVPVVSKTKAGMSPRRK